jgi:hypothetical protein
MKKLLLLLILITTATLCHAFDAEQAQANLQAYFDIPDTVSDFEYNGEMAYIEWVTYHIDAYNVAWPIYHSLTYDFAAKRVLRRTDR